MTNATTTTISRALAPLVALVALVTVATTAFARPAAVGRAAPPFVLEDLAGDPVTSHAFAGKPLYVNVFASWCPPCRMEMPLIARTLPRYRSIAFLAVDAQESATVVAPFLAGVGVHAKVAIDQGQFAATYGAGSIPESIFIDRHGIVRAIVRGPIDAATLRKDLALIAT